MREQEPERNPSDIRRRRIAFVAMLAIASVIGFVAGNTGVWFWLSISILIAASIIGARMKLSVFELPDHNDRWWTLSVVVCFTVLAIAFLGARIALR